jgi:hypothetical protein
MRQKNRNLLSYAAWTVGGVAILALATSASATTTISQNFESSTLGSTTPPSGWSLVTVSGTEANKANYVTSAGYNGAGLGGTVNSEEAGAVSGSYSGDGNLPEGYLVDSGGPAFDATQAISGSFDFYVFNSGHYAADTFMMGNIQNGYSGATAKDPGQFIGANLREETFGNRASLVAGDNYNNAGSTTSKSDGNSDNGETITFTDTYGSNASYKLSGDTWYNATFSWTPVAADPGEGGTPGKFSYTVNSTSGAKLFSLSIGNFSLDSSSVYFGFGNSSPETNGSGTFDNISITGTPVGSSVPEPASLGLLGAGGIALLLVRRRKTA